MMTKIRLLGISLLALMVAASASANPRAKICRGSVAAIKQYQDFLAALKNSAGPTLRCYHVGRIIGGLEENMTFKPDALPNLTKDLLDMAHEMVSRSHSLHSFCGGPAEDGEFEKGVREGDFPELQRQMAKMLDPKQLASKIMHETCRPSELEEIGLVDY